MLVGWVLNNFCWLLQNNRRCHCRLCVHLPLLNATMNTENVLRAVRGNTQGLCRLLTRKCLFSLANSRPKLHAKSWPFSKTARASCERFPICSGFCLRVWKASASHNGTDCITSSTSAFFGVCDSKLMYTAVSLEAVGKGLGCGGWRGCCVMQHLDSRTGSSFLSWVMELPVGG